MSALAGNTTSAIWQNMEGNTVNAVFPLLRFVGSSDHSGVFLTQATGRTPCEVALKLVPLIPTFAELQLARWSAVAGLAHPHLLTLFEAGRCDIGGMPYLYALMERADQSLADLLKNRALTEGEARETFLPALSALAYLHDLKLVHGQIKPSNVLVVGDELKLASDTVHPVAEYSVGVNGLSAYDPPEAPAANSSTAGDIWALGVTLCEALTLQQPSGLRAGTDEAVMPSDLPPAFREIVARCLRRKPEERPGIAELRAWLGGEPVSPSAAALPAIAAVPTVIADAASVANTTSATTAGTGAVATPPRALATNELSEPSTFKLTIRAGLISEDGPSEPLKPTWRVWRLSFAAIALLAVVWIGISVFRSEKRVAPTASTTPVRPGTPAAVPGAAPAATLEPEVLAQTMPPSQPVADTTAATDSGVVKPNAAPSAVHEVIPDIPRSALDTIRGTIRVTVRVTLDEQGTVISAAPDVRGPSPYFARKALGAAKQWTFTPADSDPDRVMTVEFAFRRSGTTAQATTPQ